MQQPSTIVLQFLRSRLSPAADNLDKLTSNALFSCMKMTTCSTSSNDEADTFSTNLDEVRARAPARRRSLAMFLIRLGGDESWMRLRDVDE